VRSQRLHVFQFIGHERLRDAKEGSD
jgi:hypothetical protein